MKSVFCILGAGFVSLLIGCSSAPVALAPVGPNPYGGQSTASKGELQVFSSLTGRREGENPTWYQHTDYYVYDAEGKVVKHVANSAGYYAEAPRSLSLSAGRYLVKAQAKDYSWVEVPVTIESGRTTRVHLDDNWKLPAHTSTSELVSMPNGQPAGWRAEPMGGL